MVLVFGVGEGIAFHTPSHSLDMFERWPRREIDLAENMRASDAFIIFLPTRQLRSVGSRYISRPSLKLPSFDIHGFGPSEENLLSRLTPISSPDLLTFPPLPLQEKLFVPKTMFFLETLPLARPTTATFGSPVSVGGRGRRPPLCQRNATAVASVRRPFVHTKKAPC